MKRAFDMSEILKKMELFQIIIGPGLHFYRPLSLPSVDNSFQTRYFLKAESTRFCLRNSSIICQIRLRLEFRSCGCP